MTENFLFREYALSLPDTVEKPHFKVSSYRVKQKIFLTHNKQENRLCVKLSEIDQSVFTSASKSAIYPVPNKWGKHGWTLIELDKVHPEMLKDAITTAYNHVSK
ncbi:MAG: MmcQ/YjbR family DNA-binding protein [Bacteroidia bacterium]|nr:MmcQ/YjbR family DNA-binding protein [Bacteroidia bacterium]